MNTYGMVRPILFSLPAETAHDLAIFALRNGFVPPRRRIAPASLRVSAFGLDFASPVGMAAGFDKNARCIDGLLAQGFGFVEVGTVTPRPQSGNAKPRLFRLVEDEAIVNRFGFNNRGADAFVKNLAARRRPGIVGANIGRNKDSKDAVADYVTLVERVSPHADYITVNISSPNTTGLRLMQEKSALNELAAAVMETRDRQPRKLPVLVKIAPDMDESQLDAIAEVALLRKLDGLIVSNTTILRDGGLRSPNAMKQGGLSGKPLTEQATEVLRAMYRRVGKEIPLIGVGGIMGGADAYAKVRAGATLVQLYSGLIYRGFGLIDEVHAALAAGLARDGFTTLSEAVGADERR